VNDAFKKVTASQQQAQSFINNANAYALQLGQKAQGDATAFDKVYEQYKLAPEVTRRRMYYETMEQVLSKVDKTIVETPGVTPYLPLPQVQKSVQQPQQQGQQQ
jgi:membrane protease subunit HflK